MFIQFNLKFWEKNCEGIYTVGSLIWRNRFLQIALKLLNTLLCYFATGNHIEIVRSGYDRFFLVTTGEYSSGTCPLHPMGDIRVMGKHLFIMIVTNTYASGLRQANNSRNKAESKVKVTKKVIKCKKIKCHTFDPMSSSETPMRLYLVVKIVAKYHSTKIVNEL